MKNEDREDWALLDDIIYELKQTMPYETECEKNELHEEARIRFRQYLGLE